MILSAALAAFALAGVEEPVVKLERVSKPNEKLSYAVKSFLRMETREIGLETFIPSTVDIDYTFTAEAVKAKADGIFDFRYKRPTMTFVEGETVDHGPKKTVEKSNLDLMVTMSPINEFLETKDLAVKPKPKTGGGLRMFGARAVRRQDDPLMSFLMPFIGEVQRLALFIGSIDSAIDFQPKLNVLEVSKGDTWKRTVSYSPQKLKTKNDKTVMQRLDYVYTYGGVVDSAKGKVHRVTAELKMNSDLVQYLKDNYDLTNSNFAFKEMTFQLEAKIDYDLDLKTGHTLRGVANSSGGFKVVASQYPEDPIVEQKLIGTTKLTLVSKS